MASTGEAWRLGRRPGLDGLRAVAVLLVIASHAHVPASEGAGAVGVAVFFTLSGLLITALLLEEIADTERVSLAGFYQRRARRLVPALVPVVAFVGAMLVLLGPAYSDAKVTLGAVFYVNNWVMASGDYLTDAFGHAWSLSIEEQFYLLWPLVVVAARGRRGLLALACVGAAVSVGLRVALWDGGAGEWRVYFGSDTRADGLLIGCALAVFLHHWGAPKVHGRRSLVVGAVAVLAVCTQLEGAARVVVAPLAVSLATVALVLVTCTTSLPALEGRWLGWVGRRSYGLYLWHYPVAALLWNFFGDDWVRILAVLVPLTFGIAALSWRFVEQPFLRTRDNVGTLPHNGRLASTGEAGNLGSAAWPTATPTTPSVSSGTMSATSRLAG